MVQHILRGRHSPIPMCETFDLLVDGSSTPVIITNQEEYTYVMRIIFVLYFTPPDMDWDLFGGDTALANGLELYYNEHNLFASPLKKNSDFHRYGFNVEYQVDEKNPHNIVLSVRCLFTEVLPLGLRMFDGILSIKVSDDLTALTTVTAFDLIIQGWIKPI